MTALVSRREALVWATCILFVALVLIVTGFASDDPDSALYADLSARLAQTPASRWIAPEWWGNWDSTGLFREHPAGVFVVPTLLAAAGVPGVQAAYIVGIVTAAGCLLLSAMLIARVTSREDARAALVLLQLMPLASIFRIRANHEYPMLFSLLLALVGLDLVRRHWRWVWVTPVALTVGLLVKGVFVAVPLLASGFWAITNPTRAPRSGWRVITAGACAAGMMGAVAVGYDAWYVRETGESFWVGYWGRQLGPLTVAAPGSTEPTFLPHLWFYAIRMLWHPAPWSIALLIALVTRAGRRPLTSSERRGLLFAVGFAVSTTLLLAPVSRFAERYTFSANHVLACAGVVVALRLWPSLRATMGRLDRAVPALPAWCWLGLMLLRLTIGPLLPRISG